MSSMEPYVPREYRVTGTTPKKSVRTVNAPAPRKATASTGDTTIFWVTIGLHGVLIAVEIYLAHKNGWI